MYVNFLVRDIIYSFPNSSFTEWLHFLINTINIRDEGWNRASLKRVTNKKIETIFYNDYLNKMFRYTYINRPLTGQRRRKESYQPDHHQQIKIPLHKIQSQTIDLVKPVDVIKTNII